MFDHRRRLLISLSLVRDSLLTGVWASSRQIIVLGRRRKEARTGVLNIGPERGAGSGESAACPASSAPAAVTAPPAPLPLLAIRFIFASHP